MNVLYFVHLTGILLLVRFERNVRAFVADDVSGLIVAGIGAQNGAHPWQLSLQRKFGTRWRHTCGAALIGERYAVTALHCVVGRNETTRRQLRIVAGAHGINPPDRDAQIADIRTAFITPFGITRLFDVALLLLDREVNTNRSDIATIEIAGGNDSFIGQQCVISGWGSRQGQRPVVTHILQEATMKVLSNRECEKAGVSVFLSQICVWDKPRRTSTCFGDSGGPLVCRRKDQTPVLVGLASAVFRRCDATKPNVFSRISIYRNWIRLALTNIEL